MHIRWTRAALADLDNILSWAAERNHLEARNISQRVQRSEDVIRTFPKAAFFNQELNVYEKTVPRTRVILVYEITETTIVIRAAFHTSRDQREKRPR